MQYTISKRKLYRTHMYEYTYVHTQRLPTPYVYWNCEINSRHISIYFKYRRSYFMPLCQIVCIYQTGCWFEEEKKQRKTRKKSFEINKPNKYCIVIHAHRHKKPNMFLDINITSNTQHWPIYFFFFVVAWDQTIYVHMNISDHI